MSSDSTFDFDSRIDSTPVLKPEVAPEVLTDVPPEAEPVFDDDALPVRGFADIVDDDGRAARPRREKDEGSESEADADRDRDAPETEDDSEDDSESDDESEDDSDESEREEEEDDRGGAEDSDDESDSTDDTLTDGVAGEETPDGAAAPRDASRRRGGADRRGGRAGSDGRDRRGRRDSETQQSSKPVVADGVATMVVNDTPGEECRIAILHPHGRGVRLDSIFAERVTTATQVGNIYKGRVTNVEPAIQAAFVDFGHGESGFLHISDLHPRYFPGGDKTERVGKKIPRRDRPLIQEALRRGDEVFVQVLKQGIGTKGPTLTSYLSIPGRLLVMMPWMDKSGVSRKVEDEEQRREMRRILDSLELPDGFGFILRTAGFDRTKSELQRDATYLTRLWKVMEKRMHSVGAPCELYTESDLLVRTIRDVVDTSIGHIVVDSVAAFERAKGFLEVVAPTSSPKVLFYDRPVPIFHAFDVERQIELTHQRIVPLPSGGALVIDQTEALVAIDVNSGRSRSARDSETNAFNTNCEAVDEIARQLRLRDLGGVIINDLIDMRAMRHRREIEERFSQALRRDRARTTTAPLSEFGILEMTRQRMRPSLRKTHYGDCPHCAGHGEVKMPDAVAADALRQLAHLLHYDRVHRVEMACSNRVAGVLLSGRRRAIDELEDRSGKKIEIRISDALAIDRVDLYAYDERGSDIEIDRLPAVLPPKLEELPTDLPDDQEIPAPAAHEEPSRGGRRRRRRKPGPADATAIALSGGFDVASTDASEPSIREVLAAEDAAAAAKAARQAAQQAAPAAQRGPAQADDADDERGGRRRRRRRRRGRGGQGDDQTMAAESIEGSSVAGVPAVPAIPPTPLIMDEKPRAIFDLAKELGVPSKELLAKCREAGDIEVKSHMSKVSPEICARIRAWYAPPPPVPPPAIFAPFAGAKVQSGTRAAAPALALTPTPGSGVPVSIDKHPASTSPESDEEQGGRRRRRRRRRGGKGGGGGASGVGGAAPVGAGGAPSGRQPRNERVAPQVPAAPRSPSAGPASAGPATASPATPNERDEGSRGGRSRRRRRGGRGGNGEKRGSEQTNEPKRGSSAGSATSSHSHAPKPGPAPDAKPTPKSSGSAPKSGAAAPGFRPLYGAGRSRKVAPAAKSEAQRRDV